MGEIAQEHVDHSVAEIRKQAAKIDLGQPGDCDLCGEWSARLVNGLVPRVVTNTNCHE